MGYKRDKSRKWGRDANSSKDDGPDQANHLSNAMQANPDVYYATSSEIREKFLLQNRNYRNNLFQLISQVMNLHKMYKMDWKH